MNIKPIISPINREEQTYFFNARKGGVTLKTPHPNS